MTKWFPNGVDNQKLGSLARFNPRAEWEAFGPGTNKQVIAYLAGSGGQTPQPATLDLTYLTVANSAQGDIYYYNGTNIVRLGAGTAGYLLKTGGAGANPSWQANDQTALSFAAWTAWTPTVTSTAGVITTVSASGAYIQMGKMFVMRLLVSITTAGPGAGGVLQIPLPLSLTAKGAQAVASTTSGQLACSTWIQNATGTLTMTRYDNTSIVADATFPILNGVIEVN